MNKLCAVLASIILAFSSKAQQIDTLPFRWLSGLIVIEGKVNGQTVDLIFDTGSNITVSTPSTDAFASIKVTKTVLPTRDASGKTTLLSRAIIKNLAIGRFKWKSIKGISAPNMPIMNCGPTLLLGQDVIRTLNWKFNFTTQQVYVSKQPWTAPQEASIWAPKWMYNKPYVQVEHAGGTHLFLIDLGFTGIIEARDTMWKQTNKSSILFERKGITLHGFTEPYEEKLFLSDTLRIFQTISTLVPSSQEPATPKIGAGYFKKKANYLVLNHTNNQIWMEDETIQFPTIEQANIVVLWKDSQLFLSTKIKGDVEAEVGEEVVSISGKTGAVFPHLCAFISWWETQVNLGRRVVLKTGKEMVVQIKKVNDWLKQKD